MTPIEHLRHTLKIRFRLPPNRPTDDELLEILQYAILRHSALGRDLTDDEWEEATLHFVPFTGKYLYEGLDFQDLNALLAAIRAQAAQNKK